MERGENRYDLIAPTGAAGVASVYSLLDVMGSHLAAGAVAGGGTVTGYSEQAMSHVAGVVVKGSGLAAGKAVQYIGVPLAAGRHCRWRRDGRRGSRDG